MCNWSQPSVLRPKGIQAPFEECTLQKQRFDVDVLKTRNLCAHHRTDCWPPLFSTNNLAIHMHYPSIESNERRCLRDSSYGKTWSNGGSERRCPSPRERTTNWHRLPNELFWEVAKWMCFKHLSVLSKKCNEDLLNLGGAFCIYAWKLLRKKISMQRKQLIQEKEEALKLLRSAKTDEESSVAYARFELARKALEQLDARDGVTSKSVSGAVKTTFTRFGAILFNVFRRQQALPEARIRSENARLHATTYADVDETYASLNEPKYANVGAHGPEYANVGPHGMSSSKHPDVPASHIPKDPDLDLDESLQVHTGNENSPGKQGPNVKIG